MFENYRKSRIQHCERSELRLHFWVEKVHKKCQKQFGGIFECKKLEVKQGYQIGHFYLDKQLVENAKIYKYIFE